MSGFVLHLQDATQQERMEGVTRFVGGDRSGRFGILAHHERMMTVLAFGLAQYRVGEGPWSYLALPGGLLYFVDNTLYLCTSHYLRDTDRGRLAQALEAQLRREQEALRDLKESLRRLEEELLHRLWRISGGRKS